eukprot:m.253543 g.253543  ORF g.253543 m.253543 type:complete len:100 (+) comp15932_c0_seq3:2867-3166(+)
MYPLRWFSSFLVNLACSSMFIDHAFRLEDSVVYYPTSLRKLDKLECVDSRLRLLHHSGRVRLVSGVLKALWAESIPNSPRVAVESTHVRDRIYGRRDWA